MAMFDENYAMSDEDVEGLFTKDAGGEQEPPTEKNAPEEKKNNTTEEQVIDPEKLFDPESVGSEKDTKDTKDTSAQEGTSPNVLSQLAKALQAEGIFLHLEDSDIEGVKDHESFKAAIEKQLKAQFDERQRRIDEALGNGVEPDVIRNYETTLTQLNRITEEQLREESNNAEKLRRYILRQDYLNRNYTPEQADRMVNRAISGGTDADDAVEALASIKDHVKAQYDDALEKARKTEEEDSNKRKQEASDLRKGIMESKDFFGELSLTPSVRQKVLDNIIKPIWRDPETGYSYTAIQKYEKEHRVEFLQKLGVIFTLTDGFKNLDGLTQGKVKTEVNKGLKELENALNNTQRNGDGTINFAAGVSDADSYLSGLTLDV